LAQGAANLSQAGNAYLSAGRWGEALECFEGAQDKQGLNKLAAEALAAGDFFVWLQAHKQLGRDLAPEELAEISSRAEKLGKTAFARAAEALLGAPEDRR